MLKNNFLGRKVGRWTWSYIILIHTAIHDILLGLSKLLLKILCVCNA